MVEERPDRFVRAFAGCLDHVSAGKLTPMGPVATKLLKDLRRAQGNNVRDLHALRQTRDLMNNLERDRQDVDEVLPPDHRQWMHTFQLLATVANGMLGMDPLRKLAIRVDEANAYYMPGGPPMSPVFEYSQLGGSRTYRSDRPKKRWRPSSQTWEPRSGYLRSWQRQLAY